MRRLWQVFAGESAAVFTLGFLFALPRGLYADLCYELVDGRALWSGEFPRTVPLAISAGPLVDHEWLFEAVAWPFWSHGLFAVFTVFCAAAAATTPLVARAVARRCGATPWTANAVGYLSIAASVTSYAVRPQTFAVLAFGGILLLALGSSKRPWLLGIVTVLWANVHGTAPLAPAVVLLVAGARSIAGIDAGTRTRLVVGAVWAAAGTLATPLGTRLYEGASQYSAAVLQTADWRPLSLAYPIEFFALVLYAYVLISGGVAVSRTNAVACALLAAFGGLWFEFVRFLPFFGLAAVPALTIALGEDGARQGRRLRTRRAEKAGSPPAAGTAWLALPIVLAIAGSAVVLAPLATRPALATATADDLVRETGFEGPIFVAYDAAAYLELQREPVRILLDSHATPFDDSVWADYATIDGARLGWQDALARRAITGAVAADDSALAVALSENPAWSRCREMHGSSLYARDGGAARRTRPLRCKPWTAASSPPPIPSSSPPSPPKSDVRSTTSN